MRVRFQLSNDLTYSEIEGGLNDFVRYDEWTPAFGCYKITYEDGLFYIGMSRNLIQRIEQHLQWNEVIELFHCSVDLSIYLNKEKPIRNHRKWVRMAQAYRMSETVLFERIDDNVQNEKKIIKQSSGPMCLNVAHNSFWSYRKKQEITMAEILSGKLPPHIVL